VVQPSAASVTGFARKLLAAFSLCWHVLIHMAGVLLLVAIHILFGVAVAECLPGILKIPLCEATWRIVLKSFPTSLLIFYGW